MATLEELEQAIAAGQARASEAPVTPPGGPPAPGGPQVPLSGVGEPQDIEPLLRAAEATAQRVGGDPAAARQQQLDAWMGSVTENGDIPLQRRFDLLVRGLQLGGADPETAQLEAATRIAQARQQQEATARQPPRRFGGEGPSMGPLQALPGLVERFVGTLVAPRDPDARTGMGRDLVRGFATGAANMTGLLGEAGPAIRRLFNSQDQSKFGDAILRMREAFREAGIDTIGPNDAATFSSQMGEATFYALVELLGLRIAGPAMRAAPTAPVVVPRGGMTFAYGPSATALTEESALRGVIRQIGEAAVTRPGATAVTTLGATPGAVMGANAASEYGGEAGREIGSLFGAPDTGERAGRILGSTAGGLFGGLLTGVSAQRLSERFVPSLRPQSSIQGAMLDQTVDPAVTAQYVQDQVEAAMLRISRGVELAVRRATGPRRLTPDQASGRVSTLVRRVEERADAIERDMWAQVPTRQTVVSPATLAPLMTEASSIMTQAGNRGAVPGSLINDILNITAARSGRTGRIIRQNGVPVPREVTVQDLVDLRSSILLAHRTAGGSTVTGVPPNAPLMANLTRLQESVLQTIEQALGPTGQTPAFRSALAVSRAIHERFTRGPLGEVLLRTRRGEGAVDPTAVVETLMNETRRYGPRGLRSVQEAGRPLPGVAPGPNAGLMRAATRATDATDDAIRSEFGAAVNDAVQQARISRGVRGIEQAEVASAASERWLARFERIIQPYRNATTRVRDAVVQARGLMAEREAIDQSAISRYFQRGDVTTERAIQRVINSSRPGQSAAQVLRGVVGHGPGRGVPGISADPDALAGLRRAAVTEWWRSGGGQDFTGLAALARSQRWRPVLETWLSPDQYRRLLRMVDTVAAIQSQARDPRLGRRLLGVTGSLISHVFGLHAGRLVANFMNTGGAGQLSLPQRGASISRDWFTRMMVEEPAEQLFVRAVFNPDLERMLLYRLPQNRAEVDNFARQAERWLRRLTTAREVAAREMFGGHGEEQAPVGP